MIPELNVCIIKSYAYTYVHTYMYIVVQVACISCDGASQNRKFFKLHANMKHTKHGVTYRSEDILQGDGSHVYFVSDVSHLI